MKKKIIDLTGQPFGHHWGAGGGGVEQDTVERERERAGLNGQRWPSRFILIFLRSMGRLMQ